MQRDARGFLRVTQIIQQYVHIIECFAVRSYKRVKGRSYSAEETSMHEHRPHATLHASKYADSIGHSLYTSAFKLCQRRPYHLLHALLALVGLTPRTMEGVDGVCQHPRFIRAFIPTCILRNARCMPRLVQVRSKIASLPNPLRPPIRTWSTSSPQSHMSQVF